MERLDSRVRLEWSVSVLVLAVLVGAGAWLLDRFVLDTSPLIGPVAGIAVAAAGFALIVFRYRVWRYELQDDALFIVSGVLTRVHAVVPYVRVQHVDTQRGPLERLLGLASVVVYTAGSRGADVTIPGLTPEAAAALQERLRELAVESEPEDAV